MIDERLARQCCELLVWEWGVANPPPYPGAAVGPWDDGSLTFGMRVPGRSGLWLLDIGLPPPGDRHPGAPRRAVGRGALLGVRGSNAR